MILLRKPLTIYDVDLIGVLVLVALVGGACGWPLTQLRAHRAAQAQLHVRLGNAQAAVHAAESNLAQVQTDLDRMEAQVNGLIAEAPRVNDVAGALQRLTAAAKTANLTITQLTPRPIAAEDSYLVNDVDMVGSGSSRAFLAFLDQLARSAPYQSLEGFTVHRDSTSDNGDVRLTWTMRLYLLPDVLPSVASTNGAEKKP